MRNNTTESLKRIQPISHEINAFLKKSGLPAQFFCHDMTFENGYVSLLSNNAAIPTHYHQTRMPFVFTNKNGRTISNGAYLTHYFQKNKTAGKLSKSFLNQFSTQHILQIVMNNGNQQHSYSFTFNSDEACFLHHVINHYYLYQRFILHFNKKFSDVINCERDNHQFELPLSDDNEFNGSFSSFDTEKTNQFILSNELDNTLIDVLSPQQIKCLALLKKFLSAKEIAFEMNLSHRTIEHYISHIKSKLNCKNIKELIAL